MFAVVELPYNHKEVTIESAAADGTVTLDYLGLELVLAPDQRWECEAHSRAPRDTYTIALTRRVYLENLGIKDKSSRKPRQCAPRMLMPSTVKLLVEALDARLAEGQ